MGDLQGIDYMVGVLHDPFEHFHMGITAENVAAKLGISRQMQDELALTSQRRAARAIAEGRFAGQPALVGIVLQLLSGSCSDSLRSYLHYLNGTLLADDNAAIDSFRLALLERADNVEAIVALAKAYVRKGDTQKALFFVRQAKAIGVADTELAAELKSLELKLVQG